MPSRKDAEGTYRDTVICLSKEARASLQTTMVDAYLEMKTDETTAPASSRPKPKEAVPTEYEEYANTPPGSW